MSVAFPMFFGLVWLCVVIWLLSLAGRFVSAHERIAASLERYLAKRQS